MILKIKAALLFISIFLVSFNPSAKSCSMYKITSNGKTMVGCNEDAWRTTSRIWFVTAQNNDQYGACFTGSRKVDANRFAPQSGMNEKGLVFSRLTSYHPIKHIDQTNKKQITNEVDYLTNILQTCKTIDEVKNYIDSYDHSVFIDDVYLYIDQSGDYLVVEPYKLIKGNDPSYVLANFCPSITDKQKARKQLRYKHGEDFIDNNGLESSLEYCRSLSNTMHVCRDRNGDGTLLTSIWDTQNGLVNLYFYHNYESTVQFDVAKELALGNHIINIPDLFPDNLEYNRLIEYKTPFNTSSLRFAMVVIGGILILMSFLYLISYYRKRNSNKLNLIKLVYAVFNVLLFIYLFVLATNINVFYFNAPYQHHSSIWISISSYMPIALLLAMIPISSSIISFMKKNEKNKWISASMVFNNIIYLILLYGFNYWGLFDIIH